MKLSLVLFCVVALLHIELVCSEECNETELVKCYTDGLDEFSLLLYELNNNAATIKRGQCYEGVELLTQCIEDRAKSGRKHNCPKSKVIPTSYHIIELLTHQQDSGTFLAPYYMLQQLCSEQVKSSKQWMGCLCATIQLEITMGPVTNFSKKFRYPQLDQDSTCRYVQDQVDQYNSDLGKICPRQTVTMCESLVNMVQSLYEDQTAACNINCNTIERNGCNRMQLAKCITGVLDEWLFTLYEIQESIFTIDGPQCAHVRNLKQCMEDLSEPKHRCSKEEVLELSYLLTDLLTHEHSRQGQGTFLTPYYLLQFPCEEDGQKMLDQHRDCFSDRRIRDLTKHIANHLAYQFKFLRQTVDEDNYVERLMSYPYYYVQLQDICSPDAVEFICKSEANMIKQVYKKETESCEISCTKIFYIHVSEAPPEIEKSSVVQNAKKGDGFAPNFIILCMLQLVVVLFCMW